MHAVTALLAGVRGAEGGYARLYARGTTTRATWYDTFEGDNADSSGDDIDLDENGGAEVYVSELVDVLVLDSGGAEVRRFTDGYAASGIEVRSQSFTGTDYDDASTGQGSNFPTTLQAVLDRWKTKTGSFDWDVVLGATTYELVDVLGRLAGPAIYNVQSDEFGALGNGVANDTTAIDAAIDAADAAGGGVVFFPEGTYLYNTNLSVPAGVSLLGVGSKVTALLANAATECWFAFSGAGTAAPQYVHGLRFGANVANSGTRIKVDTGARALFSCCQFGDANCGTVLVTLDGASSTAATFEDCEFKISTDVPMVLSVSTGAIRYRFGRCRFVIADTSYTPALVGSVVVNEADFVDCIFDGSAATAGTFSYFKSLSTTLSCTMRGCRFLNGGGATVTAITLGSYTATSVFEESDSFFGTTVTAYSYLAIHAGNSKGAIVRLNSREGRRFEVTDNSVTIASLPWDQYGVIVLKRTTNADQTVNLFAAGFATVPPDSSRNTLVVWNASGGAIANEIIQVYAATPLVTHTTLNNQQCAVHDFLSFVFSGTLPAVASVNVTDQQSAFG